MGETASPIYPTDRGAIGARFVAADKLNAFGASIVPSLVWLGMFDLSRTRTATPCCWPILAQMSADLESTVLQLSSWGDPRDLKKVRQCLFAFLGIYLGI